MARTTLATWIGALAGALAFFGFGLMPGAVWGGFVGVVVGRALLGRPLGPGAGDRLAVGAGMAVGVVLTLLVFAAVGAWLGRHAEGVVRRRLPH